VRTVASARLTRLTWLVVVLAAVAALVAEWTPLEAPAWAATAGAVTVTVTYSFALGARTGGRPVIAGLVALVLSVAAVVSDLPVLLAGAAVCTAALGAVLGVLATVPAARFPVVVRECLLATTVAVVAALAAAAYGARLAVERADYLVLALGLLGALVLAYRLGAGFQGLGRRGALVVVGGLALLALTLAYTEALSRWGSPEMLASLEAGVDRVREVVGAVPRPIAVLLGFPALAWGVSTRARRRQGWWPSAFGAAGLAAVATSLLDPAVTETEAALSLLYGATLGLFLGYLVIRVDTFLSGTRGSRARRAEEASAHRPEPRRTEALL
jgi:hypothetical protein